MAFSKSLSMLLATLLVLNVAQECPKDADQVNPSDHLALIQKGVHYKVTGSSSPEILAADADSKPIAKHASVEAVQTDASVKPVPITDKGLGDPRLYQGAVLANGLQVLNIQDNSSLDSAMAMGVLSGSFDEPEALPGLAHFCEHMLFLGSKKYPEASGFSTFLSQHGGSTNAFTSSELTDYFFQASSSAAVEIMPRFADWFSQPLFNRTYVEKEVHAINSEHAKNVQDPGWRTNAMFHHLANPKSPVSWFSTGNIETLLTEPKKKGIDTVAELRKYFEDHYCPPKMRLVTFGPTSLAKQFAAAEKAFGTISRGSEKCQKPISWAKPVAWPKDRLGKFVTILGTQPQEELRLMFPTPDTTADYASRPEAYLKYVFSYAGMNSLSRVLSDTLNLISDLQVSHDTNSATGEFYIALSLTPKGRKHYGVVLDIVYSYIATVRRAGADQKLYQTLKDLSKLEFDWAGLPGASSTVESFAAAMKDMSLPDVIWGGDRIDKLDVPLVNSLLKLLTPDNMIAALILPGNESEVFHKQTVHTLPYYEVKYSEQSLQSVLPGQAAKWQSWLDGNTTESEIAKTINHDLSTIKLKPLTKLPVPPGPIVGIPKDIPLDHMHAEVPADDKGSLAAIFGDDPKRLQLEIPGTNNTSQEVWYRSGWMTNSPQVKMSMILRPLWNETDPEASAQEMGEFTLYNMLLGKEMTPGMVDLTVTGVSYGITSSSDGLAFSFSGFTPSLQALIKKVLEGYSNFTKHGAELTPMARWEHTKEEYRQQLQTHSGMPMSYAVQDRNMLISGGAHSQEELLDALEKTTLESVLSVGKRTTLSKPLRLTALAVGNLDKSNALKSIQAVQVGVPGVADKLREAAKRSEDVERVLPIVNPALPVELRKLNPRDGDPNDVVVVTALYGVSDPQARVVFGILGDIFATVAYEELRTQRQLGYVVNGGMVQLSNVLGVSCVVQGTKLKADEAEAAVESVYHKHMPEKLAELTDEDFKSYVSSFKEKLIQPPTEYNGEFGKFWGPVTLTPGGECFGLDDEMLCSLRGLTSKQPLIDAWKALMDPENGMRKKLVVKYFAGSVPDRPTSDQANAAWKAQGVPDSATKLLQKEYDHAVLLEKADASERAKLLAAGGKFPLTMECKCDAAMQCGKTEAGPEKSSAVRIGAAGLWTLAMLVLISA